MKEKLLSCPFCGQSPEVMVDDVIPYFEIYCNNSDCLATVNVYTKRETKSGIPVTEEVKTEALKEIFEIWNKRK